MDDFINMDDNDNNDDDELEFEPRAQRLARQRPLHPPIEKIAPKNVHIQHDAFGDGHIGM
jgi:hypothetical protein